MTAIACPYCGAVMNLPLKFCVSCGHALSDKHKGKLGGMKSILRTGITKKLNDSHYAGNYNRAKKSYAFQQMLREAIKLATFLLGFLLLYTLAIYYTVLDPRVSSLMQKFFSPIYQSVTVTEQAKQSAISKASKKASRKAKTQKQLIKKKKDQTSSAN